MKAIDIRNNFYERATDAEDVMEDREGMPYILHMYVYMYLNIYVNMYMHIYSFLGEEEEKKEVKKAVVSKKK
jgi:hypothetical protein